ncbi:MAG: helix-hairpin-helix domain-containing protein [Dokdonella sp.]
MNIKSLLASIVFALALLVPGFAAADVDINSADATTLAQALNGIGMSKAEAIVAHREVHGPFASADDLAEVKGIGAKTVERNRDVIVVGASKPKSRSAKVPVLADAGSDE